MSMARTEPFESASEAEMTAIMGLPGTLQMYNHACGCVGVIVGVTKMEVSLQNLPTRGFPRKKPHLYPWWLPAIPLAFQPKNF